MLLLKIRGITISYSSSLKKAEAIQEKTLLKDIDVIESSNSTHVLLDTLEGKRGIIKSTEKKVDGKYGKIRSKLAAKWRETVKILL